MLRIYNTMTRSLEVFEPLENGKVKMFTCGPSIYQRPHLGNYRTFLYEDVLERYLEYLGYQVERTLNFTDVEDKAIAEAEKEKVSLEEVTRRIADEFFDDAALLRMRCPTYNPRSSTAVDQASLIIKTLLDKGYAYWYEGDVFYDPLKFKGFGKLFRLDMTRWPRKKRHFRKDTYPGVQWNLGDFILWHGYKSKDKVYWDTDIGRGRPSWNIQDAAMATKHLGLKIDLWCGGIDNLYRHHDYTIAIVEAMSGKEFVRYWLHGEHLLVEGKKMSKSKGNVVYLDDVLEKGYSPEHIRFYLIYHHYRRKMNLTEKGLQNSSRKLDSVIDMVKILMTDIRNVESKNREIEDLIGDISHQFEKHMNDDLDVKGAFDAISRILHRLSNLKRKDKIGEENRQKIVWELRKVDKILRVIFPD